MLRRDWSAQDSDVDDSRENVGRTIPIRGTRHLLPSMRMALWGNTTVGFDLIEAVYRGVLRRCNDPIQAKITEGKAGGVPAHGRALLTTSSRHPSTSFSTILINSVPGPRFLQFLMIHLAHDALPTCSRIGILIMKRVVEPHPLGIAPCESTITMDGPRMAASVGT
jgi:hypothetical protein